MVRLRAFVLVCGLCLFTPLAHQSEAATIRDMVVAVQEASTAIGLRAKNARAADELAAAEETLRAAGVLDEDLDRFVRQFTSPDAIALAHRRQRLYTTDIKTAVDTIKRVANDILVELEGVTPAVRTTVGELQHAEQTEGLKWDLETLRLFERKYGPGSAKLNGLEVLAAYGLQRLRAFGLDADDRPGPLEAVLAYSPSYITRSDDKMRLTGVAEIGLRHYFFGQAWGTATGKWAWARPRYSSYGVAWAGRSDDPLTPPWQGSSRFGAFVGWGEIKVAWLGGADKRLLVTQQIQLIPWVF